MSQASAPSRAEPQQLARRADFSLGAATIRPSVRTVEGPGGSAPAEPRVMQVLVALADAQGAVLSRDDLIRSCWKGQIVGDDSINRAISEVRRIARKTEGGFEIETIPRIGFRLKQTAGKIGRADPVEGTPPRPDAIGRRGLIVGGLAVAAAAGGTIWATGRPSEDRALRLIEQSQEAMLPGSEEAGRKAVALLEQAVAEAPANANAWGLLALTRARVDEHAMTRTTFPTAKVFEAANRALEIDPRNADAKAALALAAPYYGDWLNAERRYDAVLADYPDHVVTWDSRSFFYGAVGRMRESATSRMAFLGSRPFDAGFLYREVYALWFLGRLADADRAAARGLEMWPGHSGLWFAKLWVLAATGRFQRAVAHVNDKAMRPELPAPMIASLRAAIGAAESRVTADVDRASQAIVAGVGKSVAGVVNALMCLNLMGATDAAFAVAQAYYLEDGPIIASMQWRPGQPNVPDQRRRKTNMLFTPVAAGMRRDPRFMPMLERMGLAAYWDRRGVTPDFLRGQPA
ncbi:winged helix-turn-helix domain-containing protein [Tsuneonella sp. HG249]